MNECAAGMKTDEKTPLISVIIPVYNVAPHLRRCLDSVRAQTYNNLEVLLVDDGSSDGSESICDEYVAKDSRFSVIHKENGGVSTARNAALDVMRGELVGCVDSDDYIEPDFYTCLYNELNESGADIVACGTEVVADAYTRLYTPPTDGIYTAEQLFEMFLEDRNKVHFMMYSIWNRLYRRVVFNGIRFPEHLPTAEDRAIFPKLLLAAKGGVKFCTGTYYTYYKRQGSLITSGDHDFKKDAQSAESYYDEIARAFPRLKPLVEREKTIVNSIVQIERIHYSVINNTQCSVKMTRQLAWTVLRHSNGMQDKVLVLALLFIRPVSKKLYCSVFAWFCRMMSKRDKKPSGQTLKNSAT